MQWTAEADAKLFGHVLRIHNVKLDYAALAEAMGNDCTPKAIVHRVTKVRSMTDVGNKGTTSNDTTSPSKAKKAPAKRARTAAPKAQSRAKKTKGVKKETPKATTPGVGSDDEEGVKKEDESEYEENPTKKRKVSIFGGDAVGSSGGQEGMKEDDQVEEDYA